MAKGNWVILLLAMMAAACHPKDAMLNRVDDAIQARHAVQAARQQHIDSIYLAQCDVQTPAERFAFYGTMFDLYRAFHVDSQLNYAQRRIQLAREMPTPEYTHAAKMNMAEVWMRSGMYYEANQYLDSITASELDSAYQPYYYYLRRTLYGLMTDFAITPQDSLRYSALTQLYRDSIIAVQPAGSFYQVLVRADGLTADQRYDEALSLLEAYEAKDTIAEDNIAIFAITKAQIYKALCRTDEQKQQLVMASCADLDGAVREYVSLRELALLLYRQGDIDRAYSYMQCAIEDAQAGGVRGRTVELSTVYPIIEDAYMAQKAVRTRLHYALLASLGCIVLMLLGFVVYYARSNRLLQQSDQIKAMYIGRYMEMASMLIERFDEWRKSLHKAYKNNDLKQLETEIASKRFTQEQLNTFYHDFDEAFLNIFPDFVDKVKTLLVDDAEIRIKPGERLNTDLRVLCCIRLGITDSSQIASFLRYSLSTIYNSRTRMRNLAKEDREYFEQKVATL